MALRRYGTFTGGIELPDQKSATLHRLIAPAPPSARLLVPLQLCGDQPGRPVVSAGQAVQAGQKLAEAPDPSGVGVYAPLAGRVASLEARAAVARPEGFRLGPAIELVDLGPAGAVLPQRSQADRVDHRALAKATEVADLREGDLTTHALPTWPLNRWMDRATSAGCDVLIANAVEGQPYVTADHRLLAERGAEIALGLHVLASQMGARCVFVAVDRRRTGSFRGLARAAKRFGIVTIALPHRYPTGANAMLAKVLTRRQVPPGGSALDVGVAVTQPATCLAAFRWVFAALRDTHRVVTVSGERAAVQENFWTPLGTPCADLAGGVRPLIHGGPMTGLRCDGEAVVSPATDALLAIEEVPQAVPTPCIRCGWCSDHCPVRLNVAILNDDFELSRVAHARRLGVAACLVCGVCSYVCPARLPLTARVQRLQQAAAQPAIAEATG